MAVHWLFSLNAVINPPPPTKEKKKQKTNNNTQLGANIVFLQAFCQLLPACKSHECCNGLVVEHSSTVYSLSNLKEK